MNLSVYNFCLPVNAVTWFLNLDNLCINTLQSIKTDVSTVGTMKILILSHFATTIWSIKFYFCLGIFQRAVSSLLYGSCIVYQYDIVLVYVHLSIFSNYIYYTETGYLRHGFCPVIHVIEGFLVGRFSLSAGFMDGD